MLSIEQFFLFLIVFIIIKYLKQNHALLTHYTKSITDIIFQFSALSTTPSCLNNSAHYLLCRGSSLQGYSLQSWLLIELHLVKSSKNQRISWPDTCKVHVVSLGWVAHLPISRTIKIQRWASQLRGRGCRLVVLIGLNPKTSSRGIRWWGKQIN